MNRIAANASHNQANASRTPLSHVSDIATKYRRGLKTLVCACSLLCLIPGLAGATTIVYLYDANGTPVATATCNVQGGHVYDLNSNMIGTVDSVSHILNANGQVIGYVGYSGGGGD